MYIEYFIVIEEVWGCIPYDSLWIAFVYPPNEKYRIQHCVIYIDILDNLYNKSKLLRHEIWKILSGLSSQD